MEGDKEDDNERARGVRERGSFDSEDVDGAEEHG